MHSAGWRMIMLCLHSSSFLYWCRKTNHTKQHSRGDTVSVFSKSVSYLQESFKHYSLNLSKYKYRKMLPQIGHDCIFCTLRAKIWKSKESCTYCCNKPPQLSSYTLDPNLLTCRFPFKLCTFPHFHLEMLTTLSREDESLSNRKSIRHSISHRTMWLHSECWWMLKC